MKVLIAGGYGVFGGRLARLLVKDGHDVVIAGRSLAKAQRFAQSHGGAPCELDVHGDLSAIDHVQPHVVVDTAGPYQRYGDGPPRLAEYCLQRGIHYLDLSDDAAFTRRIGDLDALAQQVGCLALSGASSVPALSAAVVTDLSCDLDSIDAIDTAILPGNNAPRGRSVVASVLAQIGAPLTLWHRGQWQRDTGWSAPETYVLPGKLRRTGRLIGAPDLELFPPRFQAQSVTFRAGTELGFMNRSLAVAAMLRKYGLFRPTRLIERLASWGYDLLKPVGSPRGGMCVTVSGRKGDTWAKRVWWLYAGTGDGPFVPTLPARALLRRAQTIAPGARPCLSDLTLNEIDQAMADLDIETHTEDVNIVTLFQGALAAQWATLPQQIRALHEFSDEAVFEGHADVERGRGLFGKFCAFLFRFPKAGKNVPVSVTKSRRQDKEIWCRTFGPRSFQSRLRPAASPGMVREAFWPFEFELDSHVENDSIHLPVRRGWCLGMPWPRFLLPRSEAREYVQDSLFRFDVALYAPLTGDLIVRYRGHLTRQENSPIADSPKTPSATKPPSPPHPVSQS